MSILVRLDKQSSVSRMSDTQHAGVFYRLDSAGIKMNPVTHQLQETFRVFSHNPVRWKIQFLGRHQNSLTSSHYRTCEETIILDTFLDQCPSIHHSLCLFLGNTAAKHAWISKFFLKTWKLSSQFANHVSMLSISLKEVLSTLLGLANRTQLIFSTTIKWEGWKGAIR